MRETVRLQGKHKGILGSFWSKASSAGGGHMQLISNKAEITEIPNWDQRGRVIRGSFSFGREEWPRKVSMLVLLRPVPSHHHLLGFFC